LFLEVIEVEFGPHIADWWLVWLTAGSVIASGVLGGLAFWNGREAGQIAKDASERDERYRQEERQRRADESRHSAALAMATAFWNLELAIIDQHEIPGTPEAKQSAQRVNVSKVRAITEIELLHPDEHPVELARWFEATASRIAKLKNDQAARNAYRGEAVGSVRRWRNRISEVADFLDPGRQI
jgi:hypothetical protein